MLVFKKTQWTNTNRWHCTPNHHRLWKLNTGLLTTWVMSFSTLPPDSRTLVSKWNTKLALIWKEDFGPLGNSPDLLLLSPGKTCLSLSVVQEWLNKRITTTVAKFLDTSVWWLLIPWPQPQSISSEVHPRCLNRFCLTVVRLFLTHFFFPLNFLLTCLDTALCEQPAYLAMNAYPPCEGCQWLSFGQLSDQ